MFRWYEDLRLAARTLRRRPGYATVGILTVALGVGANAAVFRLVQDVLLRPLVFAAPQRLVVLHETDRHNGTTREGVSMPDYFDWQQAATTLSGMGAHTGADVTFSEVDQEPVRLTAAAVSSNYLPLVGLAPRLGRNFSPDEDRPGGTPAVLISDSLWRHRFSAATDVLGQRVDVDGHAYSVVGVLPPGIEAPAADLWMPLEAYATSIRNVRGVHSLTVVGRLAPSATLGDAQAEMSGIAAGLEARYPDDNASRGVFVEPLRRWVAGDSRTTLSLIAAAVALVLLIAGVNLAGLALARTSTRETEFAVRLSLGAGRFALVREVFAENLQITLVGALIGLLIPAPLLTTLLRMAPDSLPRHVRTGPDATLFAVALGAALLVAVAVSLATATRFSGISTASALGTRGGASPHALRLRRALVVTEIAGAITLAAVSGLLVTSFARLSAEDPGVHVASTLVARTMLPPWRYPMPARKVYPHWPEATGFYTHVLAEIESVPGVESAAVALDNPLQRGWTSQFAIDGNDRPAGQRDEVRIRPVTPGYLKTVGLPLVAGRDLGPEDGPDAAPTLMINRAFARRYLAGRDPLGHDVEFWGVRRRIVGVVGDEKFLGLDQGSAPAVYPSLFQVPMSDLNLVVRSAGDPTVLVRAVEAAVHHVDPQLAVYSARPLSEIVDASVSTPRLRTLLFSLFGALAALLAGVGIYGLVAFDAQRRRHEFAVRMALGAGTHDVVSEVVRSALRTTAVGVAIGLAGALLAGRWLKSVLFDTALLDPTALGAAVALGALLALAAAVLPAARAVRLDPAAVLRDE